MIPMTAIGWAGFGLFVFGAIMLAVVVHLENRRLRSPTDGAK